METKDLITIIAGSSVLATIFSVLLSYFFNSKLKKTDFQNEYYKKVIDKRLEVYELIEYQLSLLKISIVDEKDGKSYHRIFSFDQDFMTENTNPMNLIIGKSIWINKDTKEKINKLSNLISQITFQYDLSIEEGLKKAGKNHYWQIANLREEIELLVSNDLLSLYDFSKLERKKSQGIQFIQTYTEKEK
jgi:hypothetical protein